MADTPQIFSHCPNCGTAWPDRANVCPHCGFVRPGVPAWPPPPTSLPSAANPLWPYAPVVPRLVTRAAWGDVVLVYGSSSTCRNGNGPRSCIRSGCAVCRLNASISGSIVQIKSGPMRSGLRLRILAVSSQGKLARIGRLLLLIQCLADT